jgi:hypothetical protein
MKVMSVSCTYTFLLSVEFPPKIIPYEMMEWKYTNFKVSVFSILSYVKYFFMFHIEVTEKH